MSLSHESPAQPVAHSVQPWLGTLAGLAALAVAMGIGRFAFTPVLPMMLEEQAVSIAGGAWLASANYLGYLLGALSAMVVRVAPARAIRGGLFAIAATTFAMAAPLPFVASAALRMAAGIASAWVLISVSAWSMEWVMRHQRPFLSSVVFAGVGSGIAAAGLLCIALDALGASASTAWLLLGAFALVLAVTIRKRFETAATAGGARSRVRWDAGAVRLVTSYGLFGFGYIIPATFLPVMAKQALGAGPAFAWSWPLFGLAAAGSTLAVAALVRRMGNRRLLVAGLLVMAAGVALPLAGAHAVTILGAALAVGGTFMVLTLAAIQEARRVAGRDATGLIAAMTAAFAAGQIIGPLTIGGAGFRTPLAIAALALVLGAALLAGRDRTQPQE